VSAARHIARALGSYRTPEIRQDQEMDDWVRAYFHGKGSLLEMIAGLRSCAAQRGLCEAVFRRLSERSPTALALTRTLLARNAGKPLARVFASELEAARFIIGHPDYLEGVRARIIDRDDAPAWRQAAPEEDLLEGLKL
jgi:enoyl-CoA hydratase